MKVVAYQVGKTGLLLSIDAHLLPPRDDKKTKMQPEEKALWDLMKGRWERQAKQDPAFRWNNKYLRETAKQAKRWDEFWEKRDPAYHESQKAGEPDPGYWNHINDAATYKGYTYKTTIMDEDLVASHDAEGNLTIELEAKNILDGNYRRRGPIEEFARTGKFPGEHPRSAERVVRERERSRERTQREFTRRVSARMAEEMKVLLLKRKDGGKR